MSGVYNTPLSPEEEAAFQAWAKDNQRLGSTYDYDARGFWREGAKASSDTGHGGDRWKKPNHPTFSTQSQYNGVDGLLGGSWGQHGPAWTFTPSETNIRNMPMDELLAYFRRAEPGNVLFAPWGKQ